MIWEVWQYLTTPVSPLAKKMGFLYEAIALAARSERCRYAWASHYQACQQAISLAAQSCRQKRIALIFGAGSAQDVPLATLSEQFEQVILVDMVFLKPVRQSVKAYPNVSCIEWDVTESVGRLSEGIMSVSTPTAWLDQPVDLVVSLNLITQLPLLPMSWLTKHFALNETQADKLGQRMIEQHLAYLQAFDAKVCLVADREAFEYNKQGELVDQFDPWWGVAPPEEQSSWWWEVVPLQESLDKKKHQVNRVAVSYW